MSLISLCLVKILFYCFRGFGKGVGFMKSRQKNSIIENTTKKINIEELKKEYEEKNLHQEIDTFVLYRIIGNDLYPRHKKGQARENLKFIMEHEAPLENCEKIWIVNRIIDQDEEDAIIKLLREYNQSYIHIPFVKDEYKKIVLDTECLPKRDFLFNGEVDSLGPEQKERLIAAIYRYKNNYLINNNGARNVALKDGKSKAKWILPWDGNCFVTSKAWKQIQSDVLETPYYKYFTVPMTRVLDNSSLLTEDFIPDPVEEPQLIFRKDSTEEFNSEFCYGRRPKVELFWRLGIPGKWDNWKDDSWDQKRRPLSNEAFQFGEAGWVARLFSGMSSLELDNKKSFKQRGLARTEAIINTIRYQDKMNSGNDGDTNKPIFYELDLILKEYKQQRTEDGLSPYRQLISDAEDALSRGPFTVIDKTTLPPSGNLNDYWHPAPYWWPNPKTKDGLPYIHRDGERVPGTRMYESKSEKYDRTRLQRVFDDSIALALAWYVTGEKKFAIHGARILERFFVNPKTKMTPHLNYSQVRMGRNKNQGFSTGIIEMKDMYYYLDAVRILNLSGAISKEVFNSFKDWLSTYLDWLLKSPQGKKEKQADNNHGIYYDLQVASIAGFLNKHSILFETLVRAQSRIVCHFATDGSQPNELKRTTTAHYCCFNLQGWINMAILASHWGTNLWAYKATNGACLTKAVEWLLSHIGKNWPYKQIDNFDTERFYPIWFLSPNDLINLQEDVKLPEQKYSVKSRFFPHDGIQPYWNIGEVEKLT